MCQAGPRAEALWGSTGRPERLSSAYTLAYSEQQLQRCAPAEAHRVKHVVGDIEQLQRGSERSGERRRDGAVEAVDWASTIGTGSAASAPALGPRALSCNHHIRCSRSRNH